MGWGWISERTYAMSTLLSSKPIIKLPLYGIWQYMQRRKMATDHCCCSGNRSFSSFTVQVFSSISTSLALNFKCSSAGSRQHISRYKTWGPSETGKLLQIVFSLNFEWLSRLVASNHLFKSWDFKLWMVDQAGGGKQNEWQQMFQGLQTSDLPDQP